MNSHSYRSALQDLVNALEEGMGALDIHDPAYIKACELLAAGSTGPVWPAWISLRDRVPEGDGEVLVTHKRVYYGDIVIRAKSTMRLFASDPNDRSMMDTYWMPLPPTPSATGERS